MLALGAPGSFPHDFKQEIYTILASDAPGSFPYDINKKYIQM